MKMNTCGSCKFFEPADATSGLCRRMPPSPFPSGPNQVTSFWPSVQTQHWCGEYLVDLVVARELPPDPQKLVN